MPLPSPLNWIAIPGPQKPLYYWHWRDTYGTSWTEEGAFEGWKSNIENTLDEEGHINKYYADQVKESPELVRDPNMRRWLNFMVDRRYMPHNGPFIVDTSLYFVGAGDAGSKIEFSREYLPATIVTGSDELEEGVAQYKYPFSLIDHTMGISTETAVMLKTTGRSGGPYDNEYFASFWGVRQLWQDNWDLVEWVVVDASPDVWWGYIIKIN